MPGRSVRSLLLLQLIALVAVYSALLLGVGLPLLGHRALTPAAFAIIVLGAAALALAAGAALAIRSAAAPVERLLAAAERLGGAPGRPLELPILGDDRGGHGLARAAVAFERVAAALAEERRQLRSKVEELTLANRSLADARESLSRSERLATVGRLAAGLAHEVGNPLGAVTGFAELARSRLPEGADPVVRDAIERIAVAAERIDHVVRELLDFARPAPPSLAAVQLGPVVEASLQLARVQARFREVEVACELASALPEVWADPRRIEQVLLNVLLNAGDATGGSGRVRVAARELDGSVLLSVADDGPGFAPADLPRLFDPFFTTKAPGQGTGLGLAVSDGLMRSMGGDISAANGAQGGAVITLAFRAASSPAPEEST
ncbi:MAG TPA: ATP-binding protein [Anaeromyxobacteraceae bacterium]|jgi:C4-dicarboxylate-specific signal transduction histidine kinase|nr:ATP-binding protein [Anaeromyxobacteraceae bacterium]